MMPGCVLCPFLEIILLVLVSQVTVMFVIPHTIPHGYANTV